MSRGVVPIRRALVSVFSKDGIEELGAKLRSFGVELVSTGGTAKRLRDAGLDVIDVSEVTGFPEVLDGRVKSLHPKIHAGLLAVRDNEAHVAEIEKHDVRPIDLVVCNFYAFADAVERSRSDASKTLDDTVEFIDIGGPTMVRSAAKNHASVTVVTDPSQYAALVGELDAHNGSTTLRLRRKFAADAFACTAEYDRQVCEHLSDNLLADDDESTPAPPRTLALRYGTNPHQSRAFIHAQPRQPLPFVVLNGSPGYINLLDALNAYRLVREADALLDTTAAASFKHVSPAGVAVASPLSESLCRAYGVTSEKSQSLSQAALAYLRSRNSDPMSSFGDFAALSRQVDASAASILKTVVSDGVIAPSFTPEALEILGQKKGGRYLVLQADPTFEPRGETERRDVWGAILEQTRNVKPLVADELLGKIVTAKNELSESARRDLLLATVAVKYTQSNSVCYAVDGQVVGVGAGQQSRVDCVKLAGRKLETWYMRQHPKVLALPFKSGTKRTEKTNACVRFIEGDMTSNELSLFNDLFDSPPTPLSAAEKNEWMATLDNVALSSDAFFPFRDNIDQANRRGVKFIVQPGGSVQDDIVTKACDEYGIVMAHSGVRLFHH